MLHYWSHYILDLESSLGQIFWSQGNEIMSGTYSRGLFQVQRCLVASHKIDLGRATTLSRSPQKLSVSESNLTNISSFGCYQVSSSSLQWAHPKSPPLYSVSRPVIFWRMQHGNFKHLSVNSRNVNWTNNQCNLTEGKSSLGTDGETSRELYF